MRSALRLLAQVKPGQFLEPLTPTGLTGVLTHPSPRPTLIYTYGRTLEKLKAIPESSVYRQSTEALTKHRLKIIEEVKPAGFDEWLQRAKEKIEADPELYKAAKLSDGSYLFQETGDEDDEWDELDLPETERPVEGAYAPEMKKDLSRRIEASFERQGKPKITWEPEPPLDSAQISDIEHKIGAGLIEEVIMVAEGELQLVDEMAKNQVWEELEEKPAPGQWDYFERGTHTGST